MNPVATRGMKVEYRVTFDALCNAQEQGNALNWAEQTKKKDEIQMASAYSVATKEVGDASVDVKVGFRSESDWPLVIADAEDAISREHITCMSHLLGDFLRAER